MSHEIDQTVNANGAAIFANVEAWHGLGTVVDHSFTSPEALAVAGLDYPVEKRPLFTFGSTDSESLVQLTEHVATVRTDTSAPLGVVGPKYEVLQNRDAFAAFDFILKDHGAFYESAGALRGGRRIFISAKLPESFQVTKAKGDVIQPYLLGFNAHDGSGATWFLPTNVRVVCANTLAAALGFGFSTAREELKRGRALRVLHTKNAADRIKRAAQVFEAAQKRTLALVENAKRLAEVPAATKLVKLALDAALAEFGPKAPDATRMALSGKELLDAMVAAQERREEKRDAVGSAIMKLIVGEYSLVGKNAWAVLNGIGEYTDHHIVYKGQHASENRFESITSGRVDDFKGTLLATIVEAAGLRAA